MAIVDSAATTRCAAVWLAVTVAAGALLSWLTPTLRDVDLSAYDSGLVWVCAAAAALAAGWLWTVTTVVSVAALAGRRNAVRGVPVPVQRLLLAACGLALAGGLATPAVATPGQPQQDRGARPTAVALAGLPMPDRASSAAPRAPRSTPSEVEVVVAHGDTLWAIASRDLGAGATDAEISVRWRQIYDLNRTVVGPDPDLVHPALRLRMPAG